MNIKEEASAIFIELMIAPKPKWQTYVLFLISFTLLIGAITVFNVAFKQLPVVEIAMFIGSVLLCITAYYFLKMFLWYRGGKELYIIEKNQLRYISDFKIYANNEKKYPFENIRVFYWEPKREAIENVLDAENDSRGKAILGFELNGKKRIDTTLLLYKYQLREIADVVRKRH